MHNTHCMRKVSALSFNSENVGLFTICFIKYCLVFYVKDLKIFGNYWRKHLPLCDSIKKYLPKDRVTYLEKWNKFTYVHVIFKIFFDTKLQCFCTQIMASDIYCVLLMSFRGQKSIFHKHCYLYEWVFVHILWCLLKRKGDFSL